MKMLLQRYLWFGLFFNVACAHNIQKQDNTKKDAWTWLYSRIFTESELGVHANRSQVFFLKENVPLFSQLIFSWNALRPQKGYFSFAVQVRNAQTGRWGAWHRMVDWGAAVQRSYTSKSDGVSGYDFVRLEVDEGTLADGFRIKVVAHDGVSLPLLKACAVSLTHFNNFKPEVIDQQLKSLSSVHIRNVPMMSQFALDHPKNDAICSPTSCSMLTSFLLKKPVDPLDFAQKSFDDGLGIYGSWSLNMAHAFERCNGEFLFFAARLNSFGRLHQRLKRGMPVVVSVRGPIQGGALPYRNGHLLVVVGWDSKKREVIVHDPAFKSDSETVRRYRIKDFLEAWERSRRLAYLVEEMS
ncbi:MAG: C39 family peptidase [Candidatus Dependentiae bacterium]|nr:C39 family peptidase [Candidatus Dependentiae bacterium]